MIMNISREAKIGIFVAAVLVASFFTINYLRGADLLNKEITIVSHYDDIEGLVPSNPVYVMGYKAGAVSSVAYNVETGLFDVQCQVTKKIPIPIDTKMTIYSTDLMGGKGIRLDLGTAKEYARNNAELSASHAPDMISSLTDMIGPLITKVSSMMDSLDSTSVKLNAILDAVDTKDVNEIVSHLNSTMANVDRLTTGLAEKTDEISSAIGNLSSFSNDLGGLSQKADTLLNNLNGFTGGLNDAGIGELIESLKKLSEMLSSPDGTLAKLTSDSAVYDNVEKLLSDIDGLVKKIEENPKDYIRIKVF